MSDDKSLSTEVVSEAELKSLFVEHGSNVALGAMALASQKLKEAKREGKAELIEEILKDLNDIQNIITSTPMEKISQKLSGSLQDLAIKYAGMK